MPGIDLYINSNKAKKLAKKGIGYARALNNPEDIDKDIQSLKNKIKEVESKIEKYQSAKFPNTKAIEKAQDIINNLQNSIAEHKSR